MSKEVGEMSFGEWLKEMAANAAVGAIMTGILMGFMWLAIRIVPKDKNGEPRWRFVPPVAVLLIGVTLAILTAIIEPPYHRVVDAPPSEVRAMMARRCILQMTDFHMPNEPVKSDAMMRAFCVPLDAPPLPADLQGLLLAYIDKVDPFNELPRRNIKYSISTLLAGQVFSNDPDKFRGPVWYWADGTRVSHNKYGLF